MKTAVPSLSRRKLLQLLDEVVKGGVVRIHHKGQRIALTLDPLPPRTRRKKIPDYRSILKVADVDNADLWSWELVPVIRERVPEGGMPKRKKR